MVNSRDALKDKFKDEPPIIVDFCIICCEKKEVDKNKYCDKCKELGINEVKK